MVPNLSKMLLTASTFILFPREQPLFYCPTIRLCPAFLNDFSLIVCITRSANSNDDNRNYIITARTIQYSVTANTCRVSGLLWIRVGYLTVWLASTENCTQFKKTLYESIWSAPFKRRQLELPRPKVGVTASQVCRNAIHVLRIESLVCLGGHFMPNISTSLLAVARHNNLAKYCQVQRCHVPRKALRSS